jgi:uncharacterized membrane protein
MLIGLAFHILGAVIWVGGMFFAYVVLRPSAGPLEPAVRLSLWCRVFARFFLWVWLSVAALLVSGLVMTFAGFGGFAGTGAYVRAMMTLGTIMILIFVHVYFAPWQRFQRAVSMADWPAAAKAIEQIRLLVGINLLLGLLTVVVGASGRYVG